MGRLLPNVKYKRVYVNTENTTKRILDAFCTLTDYDGWSDIAARSDVCSGTLIGLLNDNNMLSPALYDSTHRLYLCFYILLEPHAVVVILSRNFPLLSESRTLYVDIAKADLESEDETTKNTVNQLLGAVGRTKETLGWKDGFDGFVANDSGSMTDCYCTGVDDVTFSSAEYDVNEVFVDDTLVSSEEFNVASIQLYDDSKKLYPKTKTSIITDDAGWVDRISALEETIANFDDANTEKF